MTYVDIKVAVEGDATSWTFTLPRNTRVSQVYRILERELGKACVLYWNGRPVGTEETADTLGLLPAVTFTAKVNVEKGENATRVVGSHTLSFNSVEPHFEGILLEEEEGSVQRTTETDRCGDSMVLNSEKEDVSELSLSPSQTSEREKRKRKSLDALSSSPPPSTKRYLPDLAAPTAALRAEIPRTLSSSPSARKCAHIVYFSSPSTPAGARTALGVGTSAHEAKEDNIKQVLLQHVNTDAQFRMDILKELRNDILDEVKMAVRREIRESRPLTASIVPVAPMDEVHSASFAERGAVNSPAYISAGPDNTGEESCDLHTILSTSASETLPVGERPKNHNFKAVEMTLEMKRAADAVGWIYDKVNALHEAFRTDTEALVKALNTVKHMSAANVDEENGREQLLRRLDDMEGSWKKVNDVIPELQGKLSNLEMVRRVDKHMLEKLFTEMDRKLSGLAVVFGARLNTLSSALVSELEAGMASVNGLVTELKDTMNKVDINSSLQREHIGHRLSFLEVQVLGAAQPGFTSIFPACGASGQQVAQPAATTGAPGARPAKAPRGAVATSVPVTPEAVASSNPARASSAAFSGRPLVSTYPQHGSVGVNPTFSMTTGGIRKVSAPPCALARNGVTPPTPSRSQEKDSTAVETFSATGEPALAGSGDVSNVEFWNASYVEKYRRAKRTS